MLPFIISEISSLERNVSSLLSSPDLFVEIIKDTDIKYLQIPYYETLSVEDMLDFASEYAEVNRFYPPKKDVKRFPRQYIANTLRFIIGDDFVRWVD